MSWKHQFDDKKIIKSSPVHKRVPNSTVVFTGRLLESAILELREMQTRNAQSKEQFNILKENYEEVEIEQPVESTDSHVDNVLQTADQLAESRRLNISADISTAKNNLTSLSEMIDIAISTTENSTEDKYPIDLVLPEVLVGGDLFDCISKIYHEALKTNPATIEDGYRSPAEVEQALTNCVSSAASFTFNDATEIVNLLNKTKETVESLFTCVDTLDVKTNAIIDTFISVVVPDICEPDSNESVNVERCHVQTLITDTTGVVIGSLSTIIGKISAMLTQVVNSIMPRVESESTNDSINEGVFTAAIGGGVAMSSVLYTTMFAGAFVLMAAAIRSSQRKYVKMSIDRNYLNDVISSALTSYSDRIAILKRDYPQAFKAYIRLWDDSESIVSAFASNKKNTNTTFVLGKFDLTTLAEVSRLSSYELETLSKALTIHLDKPILVNGEQYPVMITTRVLDSKGREMSTVVVDPEEPTPVVGSIVHILDATLLDLIDTGKISVSPNISLRAKKLAELQNTIIRESACQIKFAGISSVINEGALSNTLARAKNLFRHGKFSTHPTNTIFSRSVFDEELEIVNSNLHKIASKYGFRFTENFMELGDKYFNLGMIDCANYQKARSIKGELQKVEDKLQLLRVTVELYQSEDSAWLDVLATYDRTVTVLDESENPFDLISEDDDDIDDNDEYSFELDLDEDDDYCDDCEDDDLINPLD